MVKDKLGSHNSSEDTTWRCKVMGVTHTQLEVLIMNDVIYHRFIIIILDYKINKGKSLRHHFWLLILPLVTIEERCTMINKSSWYYNHFLKNMTRQLDFLPQILKKKDINIIVCNRHSKREMSNNLRIIVVLRFGSPSCSIWTSYTSFESSRPADLDYISFGSIPWRCAILLDIV